MNVTVVKIDQRKSFQRLKGENVRRLILINFWCYLCITSLCLEDFKVEELVSFSNKKMKTKIMNKDTYINGWTFLLLLS